MELRDAAVVLGVPADATADQVRSAFRARARLLHPDRLADASTTDRVAAQAAMAQLNEANETFAAHFQRGGPSRPVPEPKAPPPKTQTRPASPPPKPRPSPPPPQDHTPISKVVPELANIAQGASRFTIEVSPGRVDICSCLTSCIDRGTHSCALGVSEAADLAAVLAREGEALNPQPLPLPEDLDDLTVRRINPGKHPAAVLLDWRSSFPDDGGESRSAWACVTLLLHGSADQPSTTLSALVRALSSAAAVAEDWDEGLITRDDAQQILFDT